MIKNIIAYILILFSLSACSGDSICIEADDFGHPEIRVKARYDKDNLKYDSDEQIAIWRDSSYVINGKPLTIVVKNWQYGLDPNLTSSVSAWCPWYGKPENGRSLSTICEKLQECAFIDGQMCTNTSNAMISNAPCIFKKGVGMYALISQKSYDPNEDVDSIKNPEGINFHVGSPNTEYKLYDVSSSGETTEAGGKIYNFSDNEKEEYLGGKLYFKILDRNYRDNSGQYRVVIKSGVYREIDDPIFYATKLVKDYLFEDDYGVVRNIYKAIVEQSEYQFVVRTILTLYIMFTAFSYLIGSIQITHTELLIRIIKIAIVSALLSTKYSWSFFNDYLFAYFIGGVEQILKMIMDAGSSGPGSASILGLMIAPQTLAKLSSVLFVDPLGWAYIMVFIFALVFVFVVTFQASVIYLSALIAIGIIITLGPIFVCFMLFGVTRSLFDNWLKQLISYSIQPIILFTGLVFISMLLREEIYSTLGFRVCKHGFPNMGDKLFVSGSSSSATEDKIVSNSIFFWWFPEPMKSSNFSKTLVNMPVPLDHFNSDGELCEAYECNEERYVDLPFLDPNTTKGKRKVDAFRNGRFVQIDSLFIILILLYLFYKFNNTTVSLARFLAGTSGSYTNISKSASNINTSEILKFTGKSMAKGSFVVARGSLRMASVVAKGAWRRSPDVGLEKTINRGSSFIKKSIAGAISTERDVSKGSTLKSTIKVLGKSASSAMQFGSEAISKIREANLKREALKSDNKFVQMAAVNTGITREKLKKDASKNYIEALSQKLKKLNPKLSKDKLNKIAENMAEQTPNDARKEIRDKIAQERHNKNFAELSSRDQEAIKIETKELRALAIDAEKEKIFKEAYAQAKMQYGEVTMSNIQRNIYDASMSVGEKVTNPEYIAKEALNNNSSVNHYRTLAKEEIISEIDTRSIERNNFTLGTKSLDIKAPDIAEKLNSMYDMAREVTEEKYEYQKEEYTELYESSKDEVQRFYDLAKDILTQRGVNLDGIGINDIPDILINMNQESAINDENTILVANKLKEALNNFSISQGVLQEISLNEEQVMSDLDKRVDSINEKRRESNLEEFNVEGRSKNIFNPTNIDDLLKK